MNGYPSLSYPIQLTPLTPVHIGSGELMSAIDYRYLDDEAGGGPRLAALDLDRFFGEQNLRAFLESIFGAAPPRITEAPALANYPKTQAGRAQWALDNVAYKKQSATGTASAHPVDQLLAGDGLAEWLSEHLPAEYLRPPIFVESQSADDLRQALQDSARGEIHLLPRNTATGTPYLPGSSLKGALRTPIVAQALQGTTNHHQLQEAQQREKGRSRVSQRFEAAALGHANQHGAPDLLRDPFRQVRLSDLTCKQLRTEVRRLQIVRRMGSTCGDSDPSKIHLWRECYVGMLEGHQPVWRGELRLAPHLADPRVTPMQRHRLPRLIDRQALLDACNEFYRPLLVEELARFRCDPDVAEGLQATAASLTDQQCLIRLGRHSHFECVTVGSRWSEPYSNRGAGNTRTYAGGTVPLGWCVLQIGR
ncbi:type III-A CRISPR-associated RAMP protein Csm5 [Botrimarina hoheduenensis]|uniref:CRISPR system Cms protein Csm5 n=1 Tax=Botrimarina hoheduenensis TaxID=2528000 RepID=A0A5C5VQY3_9BACT|nr:type III-A CRISPR-associated RAMP protein Csm5 [Botrimarina hoheduenensis]TWT40211.1 RAMP superfamily protein [Botrimarina hoheduenensis]